MDSFFHEYVHVCPRPQAQATNIFSSSVHAVIYPPNRALGHPRQGFASDRRKVHDTGHKYLICQWGFSTCSVRCVRSSLLSISSAPSDQPLSPCVVCSSCVVLSCPRVCVTNSDARADLLRTASCVLYTPSNEHFGIVPVEAMCCGAPVVAVNSGKWLTCVYLLEIIALFCPMLRLCLFCSSCMLVLVSVGYPSASRSCSFVSHATSVARLRCYSCL